MSSGVMSSNLSRSISSSLSFLLRSFMGRGSFSHRCGRRPPVPVDALRDRPALLNRNDSEKQREPQTIEPRRQYVAAEHPDDGAEKVAGGIGAEKHFEEFALVEIRDEAQIAMDRDLAVARVTLQQFR